MIPMTNGESAKCLKKGSVDKNEANNAKRRTKPIALKASMRKRKGTKNSLIFCTMIAKKGLHVRAFSLTCKLFTLRSF